MHSNYFVLFHHENDDFTGMFMSMAFTYEPHISDFWNDVILYFNRSPPGMFLPLDLLSI